MPDHTRKLIPLDTLGKLHALGYGLGGSCDDCAAAYRMDIPAEQRQRSNFDIDLPALIAERGEDTPVVGMAPVPCPRCGSRRTSIVLMTGA